MNVKKFAAFTTALILAICVAPSYTAAAQGGGECVYPTEFTNELNFTSLADYAVHGGTRAYAQSTKLYIIEPDEFGDEYLKEFDCGFEITDKIKISLSKNPQTDDAVNEYKDYICGQVLATSLVLADTVENGVELELDDCSLHVRVIKE